MESQVEVAAEFLPGLGFGGQVKSGDLVFVLDGQQLVVALRHRLPQIGVGAAVKQLPPTARQPLSRVLNQVPLPERIGVRCLRLRPLLPDKGHGILGMERRPPAKLQGRLVPFDGSAVQFDGLHERLRRQGKPSLLPGMPKDDHVREYRVAEDPFGKRKRIENIGTVLTADRGDALPELLAGNPEFGVPREFAGDGFVSVHACVGSAPPGGCQDFRTGGDDEIPADEAIGFPDRHPDGRNVVRPLGDPAMYADGSALLGQTGHLDHRRTLAVEKGGHGQHGAQRYDARAPDTGYDHIVGAVDLGKPGFGQTGGFEFDRVPLPWLRPHDGHE